MSPRPDFGRRFPRTVRVLCWIAFVLVTLFTAVLAVESAGQLAGPAAGHVGTAVVTECDDQHGTYRHCFGDFTSDDGQVHFTGTQLWGEDNAQAGQRFTAFGDPATKTVTVPASGQSRFTDLYVTVVLLVVWLLLLWICVLKPLRRRRAQG